MYKISLEHRVVLGTNEAFQDYCELLKMTQELLKEEQFDHRKNSNGSRHLWDLNILL